VRDDRGWRFGCSTVLVMPVKQGVEAENHQGLLPAPAAQAAALAEQQPKSTNRLAGQVAPTASNSISTFTWYSVSGQRCGPEPPQTAAGSHPQAPIAE